ncbi:5'-Nucleotidase domain protein [Xylanimonas cellulosilytica DSM 15894]|uniref:5'-Nucleotidase domain protein n=1 Tax=Xylanimonas cellulosilytica (strain DSM 15894 / JCM 12276 / CECT 5975 / KCTC 9989 / LMG 20990 / NBRC 107835 / XIL07) TaxID=446471 RepID=D1BZW5_XYLCX|nr:ExeM/NucH family extracellular endonuclease [Xylanimonas cellulosilytica]ACZ32093.1 5'-Nucleotidase domain protein [Xylanimonas cellulosilytica DSM 15894]
MTFPARRRTRGAAALLAATLALPASFALAVPAAAAVSADAPIVIDEVYGGGGNNGAPFNQDFIELWNTTDEPVSLDGWSVQYASAGGTWANGSQTNLTGTIPARSAFLVGQGFGADTTLAPLPTPDVVGTIAMSGTAAKVALVQGTERIDCAGAACAALPEVVDLVGWGNASAWAGSGPAAATSNATSNARTDDVNTADNAADFTVGAPTPANSGDDGGGDPGEPGGGTHTIAEIQGTGPASPLVGQSVTTTGVVTAAYPTGGFNGYVIQTPGTGGAIDATHTASDAIFVFSSVTVGSVQVGQTVQVTGTVSEFNGLTEITVGSAAGLTVLPDAAPVTPVTADWPATDAGREALESMLFAPGDFTVSNVYTTNQYGEVGLAAGNLPLLQPTDVARPGTDAAAAVEADNAARGVVLDDGATTNFLSAANRDLTPPYISLDEPVRVGAAASFTDPVIVDYRNNTWKLNPTSPIVAGGPAPVTFADTRTEAPEAVGGDLRVATFNVLNYFTTLGVDFGGCSYFADRDGNPIAVNSCPNNGPRGAWDAASLQRQQDKIVAAVNALDVDVVGLLEIENSAALGEEPDEALATLTDALNADAGGDVWAYVPSSAELPDASEQDAITNAIIYRQAVVEPVGEARALGDQSAAGQAFGNAREPIGQEFAPAGGGDPFFVVVNHLKSKGSAGPWPGDADAGDGQGASNESRVRQATALRDWVDEVTEPGEAVALIGDFNAYTHEDPLQVLYDAGYTDAASTLSSDQWSYSFGGLSGSLDHVLLNGPATERATGADVWEINADESIALQYSRYNYHGTLFHAPDQFASSDHNPVVVGLTADEDNEAPIDVDILNLNDFHGRIDANTVAVAGTVEELRAQNPDGTLFVSAGDNIGASLFASALQQDQPTIDVLNALDLFVSAVGNHEFDQGFDDLTGRVADAADFAYLGANVYATGTTTPALPEYAIETVEGVDIGFVGVVTQETPALVTPAGVAGLDFGDPVEAINRVTAQLQDGDDTNGEADVVIALVHDGASAGTPDGATLEEEVAAGGTFARIVTDIDARVDAILTGHTHKQYAWDAPVTGTDRTRPIIQTGSYGEFVGHTSLTIDPVTLEVTDYAVENVARTTTPAADLVATYPRVAQVETIVEAALAEADVIGSQPVGKVTADITTAFAGGSFVDGVWTGGTRDDRESESTLGNLVGNALRDSLASPDRGGAQIGIVNPGGLRGELLVGDDGVITYAEANGVLPFVNNLWTLTLTGAQLTEVLEQQWQTNPDGTRPSRPYLALGLSDNVTWVARTADGNAAPGGNVLAVYVNGTLVEPTDTFRVATFSFLGTGGDNFREFTDATDVRDSGLVDRDAWIDYIRDNSPLTPSFARTRAVVDALPPTVQAGDATSVALSGLDLTSLGSPANTTASATLVPADDTTADGIDLGDVTIADGATSVGFTVPAGTAAGDYAVRVVAAPSGTTVLLPLTVEAAEDPAYPDWSPATVYTGGERVTFRGAVYQAQWWTQGAAPDASPWGSWMRLGAEVQTPQGTVREWTDSWVYTGGETVVHDGRLWRAMWWTRNQEPGAEPWGPWQDLGAL